MITKRKLIELIQDRLGSTGTPADIRKRYRYQTVEELIGMVYSDVSYMSPDVVVDMAMEYPYAISGTTIKLSPKPVGTHGIVWVSKDNSLLPFDFGGMENRILSTTEPGRIPGCYLRNGDALVFSKPLDGEVVVLMVPLFQDLGEADNVLMIGAEAKIYEMVVQLIRITDVRPEDVYNDGRDDSAKVQPKQERVK